RRYGQGGGTVSEAEGYPGVGRVLVVIPTYNEADNIRMITGRVRAAVPAVDVLVADDNSPDGTGAIADELALADNHIFVLHRAGKEGLGAAYKAGFAWAKDKGYDAVVEMDADGSHAPEELASLLDALRANDAVLGTRYIAGGSVHNWPAHRLLVLDAINVETVASTGYSFQVELAWRTYRNGFRLTEVPITFTEREHGV